MELGSGNYVIGIQKGDYCNPSIDYQLKVSTKKETKKGKIKGMKQGKAQVIVSDITGNVSITYNIKVTHNLDNNNSLKSLKVSGVKNFKLKRQISSQVKSTS